MKSNVTLGTKIMSSVSALLLLAMVISGVALLELGDLKSRFDHSIDITVRKMVLADAINTAKSDMVAAQRLVVIGAALHTGEANAGAREFRSGLARAQQSIAQFEPLISSAEGRTLLNLIQSKFTEWAPCFEELEKAALSGNAAEAERIRELKTSSVYEAINQASDRLTASALELLEADQRDLAQANTLSHQIILGLLGVALLAGASIFLIVRHATRDLRLAVHELDKGSAQVASAASQVSSASQMLAQGSSEQAASLEETSASSEQINATSRRNADSTRSAAQMVQESQQKFTETTHSLERMVVAMDEINSSSEKISKIIKVIDEVAFQTNILALNAAVEAARAGEAGMGFAVVADEVRNLAQRCAQAARDTAGLIEESIGKSRTGKESVDQVASAVRDLTEISGRVRVLVDEVNLSSQEQSRGTDQVAKAIMQMEQVTQRVAASAEQSASASEELTAQSASLKDVAKRVAVMVGE